MQRFSLVCLGLLVAFALVGGKALAQDTAAPQPPLTEKARPAEEKSAAKDETFVVLSTNDATKSITVKKQTDPLRAELELEKTLLVEDKALASMKNVRPGQTVKLKLKKDAKGKEVVSSIESLPTPATPEKQ